MQIDIIDFPSDPNGECGNLRKECLRAIRHAVTYPSKQKLTIEVLEFAIKSIKAGEKERKANENKRAAKLKAEAEKAEAETKSEESDDNKE